MDRGAPGRICTDLEAETPISPTKNSSWRRPSGLGGRNPHFRRSGGPRRVESATWDPLGPIFDLGV
jgi:hypothetical protein